MASNHAELLILRQTASQNLRVVRTNPSVDLRWESFVLNHPEGSIYHHPAWLKALEREYGQESLYLACENDDGQIMGVLPLLYTRGLPFGLRKPLSGRRLASLPRTPVAGPLSNDSRATFALLQEAVRCVSGNPGVQLQIKMQDRDLDGLVNGLVCTPWRLSYRLELPTSPEPFRVKSSHSRASIKWAINKATKHGVCARLAETEEDLRAWYSLYLETMRQNFVPPRPYRFFVALWELLRPKGMMQLVLAEQGNGRRSIIAGSVFLMFGQTVSYAFNGSRRDDLSLRPNDVIQWHAINQACENGYRYCDFGEVPEGREDLAKFKSKWGSEPIRLYRYYYPAFQNVRAVSNMDSNGYSVLLAQALWRRLPLSATSWLGDRMYSYL